MKSKIQVYKEYKNHIDSKGLLLQHIFEEYDDISKLSAYKKISWMCEIGELLCKMLPADGLDALLRKAVYRVFAPKNIEEICHQSKIIDGGNYIGSVSDPSCRCFSSFTVQRIKRSLVYKVFKEIGKSLLREIHWTILNGVDSPCRRKLESVLIFLDSNINRDELNKLVTKYMNKLADFPIPMTVGDVFVTLITTVDVNSKEWRSQVGKEIDKKLCDYKKDIKKIFLKLLGNIVNTAKDLDSALKNLKRAKEKIQPNSVKECK